jgi:hypothetical protein
MTVFPITLPPRRGPLPDNPTMSLNSFLDTSNVLSTSPLLGPYANGNSMPFQGPSILKEQFIAMFQSALALVEDDDLFADDDDTSNETDNLVEKSQ